MNNEEIVSKTAEMIKSQLTGEGSGHDWWHIYRVWQLAKTIGIQENVDMFVVELAALLHDIADYKFYDGDEEIGGKKSREWLESLKVDENAISQVVHIIDNISFKGGDNANNMESHEGKVVQDADRLDAIGAIGIARCFAYGGHKNREIYNPDVKANLHMSKEEYKNNNGSSLNHFYEKLLLLRGLMNTETGKRLAEGRHKFMEDYLEQFLAEWDGQK
jgi:uncharacterized protein